MGQPNEEEKKRSVLKERGTKRKYNVKISKKARDNMKKKYLKEVMSYKKNWKMQKEEFPMEDNDET